MLTISDLPELATVKMVAEILGLSGNQVRALIHNKRIAYVPIGKRWAIPRGAIKQFIEQNTVSPCHVETQVPASAFSKSADASTSSGLKRAAAGSAARALQIANGLKSPSLNSSISAQETPGRVIPLRS